MCWNEQVSFITFIIVVIVVIRILQTNPSHTIRWQCYFILAFITIQLLEGMLWISIKTKNKKMNYLVTGMVLIALWCQPLINCYFGARLGSMSPLQKKILLISALGFGAIVLYMIFRLLRGSETFKTVTSQSCHLKWTAQNKKTAPYPDSMDPRNPSFMSDKPLLPILYMIGMFLPLFFMKEKRTKIVLLSIGVLTLGTSFYFNRKDGSMGSMWCLLAAFYALGVVYIHTTEKKVESIERSDQICSDQESEDRTHSEVYHSITRS